MARKCNYPFLAGILGERGLPLWAAAYALALERGGARTCSGGRSGATGSDEVDSPRPSQICPLALLPSPEATLPRWDMTCELPVTIESSVNLPRCLLDAPAYSRR